MAPIWLSTELALRRNATRMSTGVGGRFVARAVFLHHGEIICPKASA